MGHGAVSYPHGLQNDFDQDANAQLKALRPVQGQESIPALSVSRQRAEGGGEQEKGDMCAGGIGGVSWSCKQGRGKME